MKASILLSIFALATPLYAQDAAAPAAKSQPPSENPQAMTPTQQAFLNLPEESRKQFIQHLTEANRVFQQKRVFECLDELTKASAIFSESPEIYNLRGSCFVEMRAFDKALADFKKAAEFTKDNPSILFNIGEVQFVTKQWKDAHASFEKILKLLPPENVALGRLVEFKLLLCKKKLGKDEEVTILAEKYDFLDDSPFYYYAKAALAYESKDLKSAEEWLARASRIFQNPNIIAPWQDTLVEFGYIKSFYGEETGDEAEGQ